MMGKPRKKNPKNPSNRIVEDESTEDARRSFEKLYWKVEALKCAMNHHRHKLNSGLPVITLDDSETLSEIKDTI